ncbi:MerR family transcriptional regulator [Peribacillus muralis]|uniref:MerR family transcriptional regulator n=1 Tax=Peribacillus muralis TaxID=264697 RepID=UPI001F4EB8A4|nr:MerR family transcriptional regulator [Peribacillus muralis]MCK1994755.1 MerR family transcriptional regulator [Peribacillus muralis]MCK2015418.1 MerR family transcriptional regulator [Peribacillus muralis]
MSELNIGKYFTTGEFAKLCNVKKQTLIHYDEIGLLTPDIKNDKGYRYYSYQQYEVFSVISLLKEFNMPLKEIKRFLTNRSPLELIQLFKEKSLELEKKIRNLHRMQKIIETKISLTEKALCMDDSQITLKLEEEEQLFLSKGILNSSDAEFLKATSDFIDFCNENEFYTGFPIGAMISKERIIDGDHDNYSFLYTKVNDIHPSLAFHVKPKGLYIVAYHKGSYENISETYKRIIRFMEHENLNIKAFAYEEYILDEVSVKGYENYLTQIMVEVE